MLNILFPTDFSDNAMNALRYATAFLGEEKAQLSIMHAFDATTAQKTGAGSLAPKDAKTKLEQEVLDHLKTMEQQIGDLSQNAQHQFKNVAAQGILIDKVNDLSEEHDVDLVVMGTRGKTNDRELTFGSNTLQLLKNIKAPVLTIPEGYSYTAPREILFVNDFMLPYTPRELELLSILAKSFTGTIHLLYMTDYSSLSQRQQNNKALLEAALGDRTILFHGISGKNIPEATNSFIDEHNIDLLVMVKSHRSYMEGLFHNSSIDALGLNLKVPFLVMQNLNRS